MAEAFSKTLSLLRKERKISQRTAASAFGISQALLSHYENGAREPNYNFLIRVARYYNVSTDFLLGITDSRTPAGYLPTPEETGKLKTLYATLELIFGAAGKLYDPHLLEYARKYLTLAAYKILKSAVRGGSAGARDGGDADFYTEFCDIEMRRAELVFRRGLRERSSGVDGPRLSGTGMSGFYDLADEVKQEIEGYFKEPEEIEIVM